MRVLVICFIERQTKKCIGIIKKKFYITVWKLKKIKRSSLKHWKAKILNFLIKAPLVEPGGARGAWRSPDWAPGSSEKIWRSQGGTRVKEGNFSFPMLQTRPFYLFLVFKLWYETFFLIIPFKFYGLHFNKIEIELQMNNLWNIIKTIIYFMILSTLRI